MKTNQRGFVFLEMVVAIGLAALVMSIVATTIVYVLKNHQRNSDHMAAVFYAETAGYLISKDVQTADSVTTDNLTPPEFLVITWTEWDYDTDSIYHVVTYSIEDLSEDVSELKRVHQDSTGTYEEAIIARCIYSNESDPDTTQAVYTDSVLTLRVKTRYGEAQEVKDYEVYSRPNFR